MKFNLKQLLSFFFLACLTIFLLRPIILFIANGILDGTCDPSYFLVGVFNIMYPVLTIFSIDHHYFGVIPSNPNDLSAIETSFLFLGLLIGVILDIVFVVLVIGIYGEVIMFIKDNNKTNK